MGTKQLLCVLVLIVAPIISRAQKKYIATANLNVRTGAGKKYDVSFTLGKGEAVEVLSKNGVWYEIRYFKQTGYVSSKYLQPVSEGDFLISQQSNEENSIHALLLF